MAEQHASVEAEEQIDLDGDNDIEDMMDDEDPAEDDGYRRTRDECKDQDSAGDDSCRRRDEYGEQEPADDDSYRRIRDDYREQEQEQDHGFEDEEHDRVSESDEAIDTSGPMNHEEKPIESKDEVDKEKRAELLSLPPHGSEVFIGGLPRDATEEDLRELCEPFGEIFEVRKALSHWIFLVS